MKWAFEHGMSIRRIGKGPELVWIHGLGESSTSFDPVVARIGGYTHVLVDLPGYGRSPWPAEPLGLEALADHLASWLRARPPAVVIGHSMGGVLATLLGDRGVARGIVNIDGNISRADCTFSGQCEEWTEAEFVDHGFAELRARIFAEGAELPMRGYFAAMTFASPHQFFRHAADLVRLSLTEQLAPRLAALPIPALFVAGVPDGIVAASRALLDHHGARWIGIEPAGHWVYLDQLERFVATIYDYLSTFSSDAPSSS